jgi:hypothetical protein
MSEPTKKAKAVRKLVQQLGKLADRAEVLELKLPNGALVDQLLGGIANDLGMMIDDGAYDR